MPADPRGEGLPRAGHDTWSIAEDVHELLHVHLGFIAPDLYRALRAGRRRRTPCLDRDGKLEVPVLGLHGEVNRFADVRETMVREVAGDVRTAMVPRTGHWYAEETPAGLVDLRGRLRPR